MDRTHLLAQPLCRVGGRPSGPYSPWLWRGIPRASLACGTFLYSDGCLTMHPVRWQGRTWGDVDAE